MCLLTVLTVDDSRALRSRTCERRWRLHLENIEISAGAFNIKETHIANYIKTVCLQDDCPCKSSGSGDHIPTGKGKRSSPVRRVPKRRKTSSPAHC